MPAWLRAFLHLFQPCDGPLVARLRGDIGYGSLLTGNVAYRGTIKVHECRQCHKTFALIQTPLGWTDVPIDIL